MQMGSKKINTSAPNPTKLPKIGSKNNTSYRKFNHLKCALDQRKNNTISTKLCHSNAVLDPRTQQKNASWIGFVVQPRVNKNETQTGANKHQMQPFQTQIGSNKPVHIIQFKNIARISHLSAANKQEKEGGREEICGRQAPV